MVRAARARRSEARRRVRRSGRVLGRIAPQASLDARSRMRLARPCSRGGRAPRPDRPSAVEERRLAVALSGPPAWSGRIRAPPRKPHRRDARCSKHASAVAAQHGVARGVPTRSGPVLRRIGPSGSKGRPTAARRSSIETALGFHISLDHLLSTRTPRVRDSSAPSGRHARSPVRSGGPASIPSLPIAARAARRFLSKPPVRRGAAPAGAGAARAEAPRRPARGSRSRGRRRGPCGASRRGGCAPPGRRRRPRWRRG
jgi:hypothetical protein